MCFQPLYLGSISMTILSGSEANPCGNLTRDRTSHNSFSFYLVQDVHSWCHISWFTFILHLQILSDTQVCQINPRFKVSFVLPSILRSVPIMLSHIFFSMCITSRLCRRSKSFQYSKSHKVDLRVNNNLSSALPCFLFPLPLQIGRASCRERV